MEHPNNQFPLDDAIHSSGRLSHHLPTRLFQSLAYRLDDAHTGAIWSVFPWQLSHAGSLSIASIAARWTNPDTLQGGPWRGSLLIAENDNHQTTPPCKLPGRFTCVLCGRQTATSSNNRIAPFRICANHFCWSLKKIPRSELNCGKPAHAGLGRNTEGGWPCHITP